VLIGDGGATSKVFEALLNGNGTPSDELNSTIVGHCRSGCQKIKLLFFGPYGLISAQNLSGKFDWKPNTKINRYNVAVSPTIPVDILKNIRRTKNVSFSALALGLSGRALTKFMKEAGYEVPETVYCNLPRLVNGRTLTKLTNHV